ncbi:MAG TPA: type I restriction-modification system subunit M N-terminal domain-containing protein [Caulifigura sp.]|jgi:type I restriction enzyme R subunit|nr:type I restriction-modification system subunit M N-terminal domain-containing protein [Caulifigura sp.]
MSSQNLSSFIWSVADLLRGDYKQSEYGRVILPFTVLRRLDCVLEPTKAAVLAEKAKRDAAKVNPEPFLTYLRAYSFLSQIFDYGNTDFEKRAIFFKALVRLLKFGLEREGVDLSGITLTHHSLRNRGQRTLPLSDKETPKLAPMTEAGSGSVQEKEKAFLHEIIEKLNSLFGSDTTEGDQLSYANTLAAKTLESKTLQMQAASNSKEQFAHSPDLSKAIEEAIMEAMDVQQDLSIRALNSKVIQEGLKAILLGPLGLYERLKTTAASV